MPYDRERAFFSGFVEESNAIEGIIRPATDAETDALASFTSMQAPGIADLCDLVSVFQPGAVLRDRVGLNVRVGQHVPVRGGPHVKKLLVGLLREMEAGFITPFRLHQRYEDLHPFTDGNGRSGRALWLRQMLRFGNAPRVRALGFLHSVYYQALEDWRTGR